MKRSNELQGTLLRDVRACTVCARMRHCHTLGAGNGPADARVMFVAEAPGRLGAALTGVPLSGDQSGKRFENFLQKAGLARSEVFVTNAVLCNPVDGAGRNRRPGAAELASCRPFLARTLEAVAPEVTVALGATALEALRALAPHDLALARDAGTAAEWRRSILWVLHHPSRQSTLHRSQQEQEEDWRRLGESLRRSDRRPTTARASLIP